MKYLGWFLAFLAALLLVPGIACAAWSFSAGQMLLSADTYKNAFLRQDAYAIFIPALFPALAGRLPDANGDPDGVAHEFLEVVETLDERAWASIAEEVTPPEWLRRELERNLDSFFAWLNGETPTLELAIDTAFLREQLSGESGQRMIDRIIRSWPPCTNEQIAALRRIDTQAGDDVLPHCQPPDEYLATSTAVLSTQLQSIVRQIPDVIPDPEQITSPQARLRLEELKRSVRLARALVIELWLLPVALLALIVFFAVRSLKSFGRWAGWTLIVGGILTLLPIPLLLSPLLMSPFASSLATSMDTGEIALTIEGESVPGPAGEEVYMTLIAEGMLRSVIGELTLPVLIQSAVVIGLGFAALVVSALARSPEEVQADELHTLATASITPTQASSGTPPVTAGQSPPIPVQQRAEEPSPAGPPTPGGADKTVPPD